jgi:hypothetical protein
MSKLAQYRGSRDYLRLVELIEDCGIICTVAYRNSIDVAVARRQPHHSEWMYEVSARGIGYIIAFNVEDFISLCEHGNVEFFEPALFSVLE